jgi:hypothetical protein
VCGVCVWSLCVFGKCEWGLSLCVGVHIVE